MSLAATKRRIKVGSELKLVRHDWIATGGIVIHGNTGTTRLPSKIQIGCIRKVAAVHNTEIGLHTNGDVSWLGWPKASNYRDTPNGFEIDLNADGAFRDVMGYEFVTPGGVL